MNDELDRYKKLVKDIETFILSKDKHYTGGLIKTIEVLKMSNDIKGVDTNEN